MSTLALAMTLTGCAVKRTNIAPLDPDRCKVVELKECSIDETGVIRCAKTRLKCDTPTIEVRK